MQAATDARAYRLWRRLDALNKEIARLRGQLVATGSVMREDR
jgi:hypothetical protein